METYESKLSSQWCRRYINDSWGADATEEERDTLSDAVEAKFNEIAAQNGSKAILHIDLPEMHIPVNEPAEFADQYEEWFAAAKQHVFENMGEYL